MIENKNKGVIWNILKVANNSAKILKHVYQVLYKSVKNYRFLQGSFTL